MKKQLNLGIQNMSSRGEGIFLCTQERVDFFSNKQRGGGVVNLFKLLTKFSQLPPVSNGCSLITQAKMFQHQLCQGKYLSR